MQYLLLIYANEDDRKDMPPSARQAMFERYMKVTREMKEANAFIAGDALEAVSTATSVRVRDNKRETTDGPFAETAEQLGGYYLVEAEDLDAAIEWAARIPASEHGTIEVRPIMDHSKS